MAALRMAPERRRDRPDRFRLYGALLAQRQTPLAPLRRRSKGMAASGPEPNVVCAHKRPVLGQKPGQKRPGTSARTITKWMGHHRRCAAATIPVPPCAQAITGSVRAYAVPGTTTIALAIAGELSARLVV